MVSFEKTNEQEAGAQPMQQVQDVHGVEGVPAIKPINEIMSVNMADGIRTQTQLPDLKKNMELEIRKSGVVDKLTDAIDVHQVQTILDFGKEPAEEMARVSDMVLQNYNGNMMSESSTMIDNLLKILDKIDCGELEDIDTLIAKRQNKKEKKGFLSRFTESLEEKLNKAVGKYQTIGGELEAVTTELTMYQDRLKQSNSDIEKMYNQSIDNFRTMTAYVLAAEDAVRQIEEYRDKIQSEYDQTSNSELQFEIRDINNALVLMQKRTAALQSAEALALQSIPAFKIQEVTNANLAASINEAFIITIPSFKTALVNSVIAKQQSIMAQGLSTLNEMNSRVIRKNAENVGKQLMTSQELMASRPVKVEDIEYSMNVLMNAAKQYKEREKQMIETSKQDCDKLRALENSYMLATKNNDTI